MSQEAEEVFEMSRSVSGGSSTLDFEHTEQDQLLSKEDHSDSDQDLDEQDEAWAIIMEEGGDSDTYEHRIGYLLLRYVCIGLAVGLFFIIFKIGMNKLAMHSSHHERAAEKLYYNGSDYFASTVILISLDGFRPDYLDRGITPHLNTLASQGAMAKYMHPSFPPSTFPNHWTLVTGLYPETHGVVANLFYDPTMDATFSHTNHTATSDHRWWKGEPIWVTSKINRRRSGSIMWPEKMNTVLQWLDMPYNSRPEIITVHVPQVDQEGHRAGPYGAKMNTFIKEIDNAIGYLVAQLKTRNLDSHAHIVVVSDHGMAETGPSKLIYYDDILSKDTLQYIQQREALPLLDLRLQKEAPEDTVQRIYQELATYAQNDTNAHYQVYLREDVPERYHYSHSDRITPIVAIPDVGYTFVTHAEVKHDHLISGGNHGYDNLADDMRAIFIAKGPKVSRTFKEGTILAPFFNIEVYGFVTELLNIDAAPNNGTLRGEFPVLFSPPF
ncbi:alkaline-phosphatase-like protein [Choanephora cucurbitarum]|nr:alkaline-phosphatase-like protein [Choanephora cucurbitarum]